MTDGVRRLTHDEAEMLISARMDEHLDRADSRALLVHLQACESCRAFAVQSEVLGRELAALPVLPPSAMVDRQIRESIAKGNRHWSLASLLPGTAGNSGLRVALGALAVLTLVSVYLLVRMAGGNSSDGGSIDAPNGGLAQQIDTSPTAELAMLQETTNSGPTETPRLVVPLTQEPSSNQASTQESVATNVPEPTQPVGTSNDNVTQVEPTKTLDSAYVYPVDQITKTPAGNGSVATETPEAQVPTATEEDGQVAVAAVAKGESTPKSAVAAESPAAAVEGSNGELAPSEEATVAAEAPIEETPTTTPTEPAPEPTMTPIPVVISVDTTDTPEEPGTPPPASGGEGDITSSEPTSSPGEPSNTPEPDQAETAPVEQPTEPISTPTDSPYSQPTIAPISGQSIDEQGDDASTSPLILPNDGSDVEAASTGASTGNDSPTIVPVENPDAPGGKGSDGGNGHDNNGTGSGNANGGDNGLGGGTEPSPIPTVDDSVEPSGLDLSDTVAELPSGASSPLGRLEFSPGMDLYAVIAPDGQLAVANLDGELVVTLGPGELPVWSGNDMMFSAPGDNGTVVGIWDADSGDLSYVPVSEDEQSSDLPIGGDGSTFYYLRTFPDRPGAMEIRSAAVDGSDQGALWTSDSTNLSGARPVWSSNGILLPTDSKWLSIDSNGDASELDDNPYGYVGAPILSPGEGLMAYAAGDQVVVAWTTDPGTAVATAPFGGSSGGYAFSNSGEEIVISDGQSLHVVSYQGDDLGTLSGSQPIGGVSWSDDTIYYLQIGQDAALMSTSLYAIQSS